MSALVLKRLSGSAADDVGVPAAPLPFLTVVLPALVAFSFFLPPLPAGVEPAGVAGSSAWAGDGPLWGDSLAFDDGSLPCQRRAGSWRVCWAEA